MNDLVIAQVTDMHIGPSNVSYRGINARQQFLDVLQVLTEKKLDLLVLSGDLAAVRGEPEAYVWLRQNLASLDCPYVVMAGNHDHLARMKSAFDLPDSEAPNMLYFSRDIKGYRLLFLDSSSYRIAKQQLDWLSSQLTAYHKPALLFIHHPPLKCGCQFMDEYHALQNSDEVWQVLEQFDQIKHIFCGHYHADKTLVRKKYVHLTPSTVFQIDTEDHNFVIEHTKPGWRIIELADGQVHTYVEYL